MRTPLPSLSTRAAEQHTARELPLDVPADPPLPAPPRERPAADRIKAALLRWLEEEL